MKIPARAQETTVQKVGDELLVYSSTRNQCSNLDSTAIWLWEELVSPVSFDELCRRYITRFPKVGMPETAGTILKDALLNFQTAGLLSEALPDSLTVGLTGTRKTRREALASIGAAALVPVLTTLMVRPAAALNSAVCVSTTIVQSCVSQGGVCADRCNAPTCDLCCFEPYITATDLSAGSVRCLPIGNSSIVNTFSDPDCNVAKMGACANGQTQYGCCGGPATCGSCGMGC